jgi:hypothetical protein
MIDRDKLLNDLMKNVLEVSFTKVDGQPRTLKCTLMAHHLPQGTDVHYLREMHMKDENQHKVVVWDLISGGWKSFHVENVTYAQTTGGD